MSRNVFYLIRHGYCWNFYFQQFQKNGSQNWSWDLDNNGLTKCRVDWRIWSIESRRIWIWNGSCPKRKRLNYRFDSWVLYRVLVFCFLNLLCILIRGRVKRILFFLFFCFCFFEHLFVFNHYLLCFIFHKIDNII